VQALATANIDDDFATFHLTSSTTPSAATISRAWAAAGRVGERIREAKTVQPLTRVEEDSDVLVPERDEIEQGQMVLAHAPESAYATEDLQALESIDQSLRKLVPQAEWEAKSLSAFTYDALSVVSGSSAAAPKEPVLLDRFQKRESQIAIRNIEDRLQDVQMETDQRTVDDEDIRRLLMQAALETAPPDTSTKVLALTAEAAGVGSAPAIDALLPVDVARHDFPESGHLLEARQILRQLGTCEEEGDQALNDADEALSDAEMSMHALALQNGFLKPDEMADHSELAPFVQRLHDLSGEAQTLLEHRSRAQELLNQLREDDGKVLELEQVFEETANATNEETPELATNDEFADFHSWSTAELGPNPALLRALDIELPAGDGLWADAELEQVLRKMDAHFGDTPPV